VITSYSVLIETLSSYREWHTLALGFQRSENFLDLL